MYLILLFQQQLHSCILERWNNKRGPRHARRLAFLAHHTTLRRGCALLLQSLQILGSSGEKERQRRTHHPDTVPLESTPALQRVLKVEKNERQSSVVDEQDGHRSSENVVYELRCRRGYSGRWKDKGTDACSAETRSGRDEACKNKG